MNNANGYVTANKKHKDRLFRLIFGSEENKENILSLYNALNGTDYTDAGQIEITTIDDVLYMGLKNDVSFILVSEMNLFEHQSTYNPNMPLRGFWYFGRLYEKYTKQNGLDAYGKNLVRIPTPRYIVFYNGDADCADVTHLKLSDSFMTDDADGFEWTATMLNINKGHNKDLMEKCLALKEYSDLIALIREYRKYTGLDEAIDRAVKEACRWKCLGHFLTGHRSEVRHMILSEYDEELHERTCREEGRQEGKEEDARNFFINGASFELVHTSIPEIPLEKLQEIYDKAMTEKNN